MELDNTVLIRYLLNEISVEEHEYFNELLSKDPEFRESFDRMKKVWEQSGTLLELQRFDVDKEWGRFTKITEKEEPVKASVRVRKLEPMVRYLAASVVLLIALSVVLFMQFNKSSRKKQFTTIEMPSGERGKIILPDGTLVWLNAGSTLVYPVTFNESGREVTLEGEAYFEVIHKEDKPFRVKVRNLYIEDLGTAFNVSAYLEDKAIETTLFKGKVSIKDINLGELATLQPNERAVFSPKGLEKKKFAVDIFSTWKSGELIFNNEEPSELFSRLEREYDKEFVFHTAKISGKRLTAHFNKGEELDRILKTIGAAFELRFVIKNNEILVYDQKTDKN